MNKLFEFDEHIGDWRVLVQSRDIKNGAIEGRHIAPGTITSDNIADGAVTTPKIADGAVTREKIADGAIDDIYAVFKDLVDNYKPIVINGDVTNAPDEEDITSANGLLKLKNRSSALSNMGYVILRRNRPFAEQVNLINTIYEIRYDFDLGGETVTIPENCILEFAGGKIYNGTIVGNNTIIDAGLTKVFEDVGYSGVFANGIIRPEWFGAVNDGEVDCTNAIRRCIEFSGTIQVKKDGTVFTPATATIMFNGGTYKVTDKISVELAGKRVNFDGNGACLSAFHSNGAVLDFPNQWIYSGYIRNLNIDGNGYVVSGIEGHFINSIISGVNIKNCLKYGIHQIRGYELYIDKVQVSLEYGSNLDVLDDWSECIGILIDTNDGVMTNFTVIGYPVGLKINGQMWEVVNYHVWGTESIGCIPRIGAWLAGSYTTMHNTYIDTVLKDDPSLGNFDIASKNLINGGIGVYVAGERCIVRDTKAYVFADGITPFTGNLVVYVEGENCIVDSVYSQGNVKFYDKVINDNIPESSRISNIQYFEWQQRVEFQAYDSSIQMVNLQNAEKTVCRKIIQLPNRQSASVIFRNGEAVVGGTRRLFDFFNCTVDASGTTLTLYSLDGTKDSYLKAYGDYFRFSKPLALPGVSELELDQYSYAMGLEIVNNVTYIPALYIKFGENLFDAIGWQALKKRGTTVEREALELLDSQTGYPFFDTTLGKQLWWNGSTWKDANGFTANINKGTFAQAQALVSNDKITSADAGYEFYATDKKMPLYYGGDTKWYDASGEEVTE